MVSKEKPRIGDEVANAITHGVGAVLAVAGFVVLMVYAAEGHAWRFGIYGATLVLLYVASTLYHSLTFTRARTLFRKFDHMAIFLLIAGTYTPFCLTVLDGWLSYLVLGAVWTLAIGGILLKLWATGKYEWLSIALYIGAGWMVVLVIRPLYQYLSTGEFVLLVSGGLAYTMGTIFYMKSRVRFFHSIWHLWVLAGSILHYFAVFGLMD